jgi:hypothetical protein
MLRRAIYVSLLVFTSICSLAQNPYKVKLDGFIKEQRQEKVYLHFDRAQYAAGEDVWFKAYIINASSHLPSEVSKTLHVELINEQRNIIDSLSLLIEDGVTNGSISLKKDIPPGSYRVRAYTAWMRNYDHNLFYNKDFTIINTLSNDNPDQPEPLRYYQKKPRIQFLPEGGDLIDGLPTKIAIRATNNYGVGVAVNGTIIDKTGQVLTKFKCSDLGYGLAFIKEPRIDMMYHAIVEEDTFNLPMVKKLGASIRVINNFKSEDVIITVLSTGLDLTDGTLVIHRRGMFLFSEKCINKSSLAVVLKKSQLESGIIHITFFDRNQIPLTERLIFPNRPLNEPGMEIISDKDVYQRRSAVNLLLNPNSNNVHSASITINPLTESSYKKYGENIENYVLLTSDLKGKIESPDYYFADTEESYQSLDLLMLTHGWARFNWTSLLNTEEFSPEYWPENGLTFSAKIYNYYTDKHLNEPLVSISIPSIGVLSETFRIGEDGTFHVRDLELMDSTDIFIKALKSKGEKTKESNIAKISLQHLPRPAVASIPFSDTGINPFFYEKSKKLNKISQTYFLDNQVKRLEEVVITGKRSTLNEIDRRTLYREPSHRLILDDLPPHAITQSVFDLLRRVPGVQVFGIYPNQEAIIRGINSFRGGKPSYFLDGAPIDVTTVQNIPMINVEFIDILSGPRATIFGSTGAGGVVLIYTRLSGSNKQRERPRGLLAFTHPGYHKAKEFYSPDYDLKKKEKTIPDFRPTLYWNPELKFKKKNAEIQFYTSDQPGNFVIRVEGIYSDGKPFFKQGLITVQ